jgi:hypothetical protein
MEPATQRRRRRKPKKLGKAELVSKICHKVGLPAPREPRAHFNRDELMQVLACLDIQNGARRNN